MTIDNKIFEIDENGNENLVEKINGINIIFRGLGNRIYVNKGTTFKDCCFVCGNGVQINIKKTKYEIKSLFIPALRATNSKVVIADDFSCVGCTIHVNDSANVNIGADCMFSYNIIIFTSDGHTIFDVQTLECLNKASDVNIGQHVWVGQGVQIMKGMTINENCVIGTGSIVSRQFIESGAIIAGIPAKPIRTGINWTRQGPAEYQKNNIKNIMLLLETKHTYVYFQPGESDYLMIIFGHMGKPGRRTFWGQGAIEKLGINCIGLVPKHPHWYPTTDFQEIKQEIQPILDRFNEVICYGFSMGGFGALKYSSKLNAKHVLSFSPQTSINPDDLGEFDDRYSEFFCKDLHDDMNIKPGECIDGAFIVCDPTFASDAYHLDAINSVANINLIPLEGVKHNTIEVIASTERLDKVIKIIRKDGSDVMHELTKTLFEFRDRPIT